MENIFEIEDKVRRKIHLSKERWSHINQDHPEMADYIEEIKEALQKPDKITTFSFDEDIKYYYKYVKSRVSSAKYLLAIVKYLNGEGYIITSYFVRHIK